MSKNVFRDGQTRRAYIAAVERLHDDLAFSYRPMLPEEVEITEAALTSKEAKKAVEIIVAQVVRHVVEWSEVDDHDKPQPVSVRNVRHLPYQVLNKLYKIIAGLMPSDPLPDGAPKDDQDDYLADVLREAEGKMPIEAVSGAAKN
jgi:hypothetical protein